MLHSSPQGCRQNPGHSDLIDLTQTFTRPQKAKPVRLISQNHHCTSIRQQV
jgi:hypothetical protein